MNKEIFIENLGELLKGKMPSKEIDDVLIDYNEYFEAGKSEGKTEEELCAEFGSPKTIAGELLSDSQPRAIDTISNIKLSFSEKRFLRLTSVIIFFISLLYCLKSNDLMLNYNSDITMTLILPLFLALSGIHKLFLHKLKFPSKRQIHACTTLCTIFMALILVIIALFITVLLDTNSMVSQTGISAIALVHIITALAYTLYFLVLITAILILFLAGRNFKAFGFLFFLSGEFLCGLDIVIKFGTGLSEIPFEMIRLSERVLCPFVFGILLTALFFIFTALIKRFKWNRK